MAQAITLYESFRDAKPRKLARLKVKIPKVVACMGYVESLDYRTTHKGKAQPYRHRFAAGSRPLLCVSSDGRQLMLLGGLYKWTERGIVDRDAKGRERPDPKHGRGVNPKRTGYSKNNSPLLAGYEDGKAGLPSRAAKLTGLRRAVYQDGYNGGAHERRNAVFMRRNPRVVDMSEVELLKALQIAYNEHDTARLKLLGAEQVRRSRAFGRSTPRK